MIAIVLAGVFFLDLKFTTPVYQWANGNDLLSTMLTDDNLLLLAVIGIIFLFLSSLAEFSLRIAGNRSISYYGIEFVVFGLLIGLLLSNLFSLPA